jgi:hypothetical protein
MSYIFSLTVAFQAGKIRLRAGFLHVGEKLYELTFMAGAAFIFREEHENVLFPVKTAFPANVTVIRQARETLNPFPAHHAGFAALRAVFTPDSVTVHAPGVMIKVVRVFVMTALTAGDFKIRCLFRFDGTA